jgi:ATP-binding cassette, subfamily B (MDR/TAP), member 1
MLEAQGLVSILMFDSVVEATASANRILSVRPTKEDEDTNPYMELGKGAVGVEFQNVSFAYKGRNVPVLSNMSLKVSLIICNYMYIC